MVKRAFSSLTCSEVLQLLELGGRQLLPREELLRRGLGTRGSRDRRSRSRGPR